ncbi:MAG: hypothetical protein JSV36_07610 [Anaerolineae bacterium]|nr:MAG: hypothetical protein JSV36_07610 [Anaerolineae bacterium]
MNKSRLMWGIICLALAALLAVLAVALPENKMVFMVGDTNVPVLPAIILGIIGLALLFTTGSSERGDSQMTAQEAQPKPFDDQQLFGKAEES